LSPHGHKEEFAVAPAAAEMQTTTAVAFTVSKELIQFCHNGSEALVGGERPRRHESAVQHNKRPGLSTRLRAYS